MTIKIAIVGPESTGKSTLAEALADSLGAPVIEEFARQFLDDCYGKYVEEDLIEIAKGQLALEEKALKANPEIIISDTNLVEIEVWGLFKFKRTDPLIKKMSLISFYNLYLLAYPDLPWEKDPLRENQDQLMELFETYLKFLEERKLKYCIIRGTGDMRLQNALKALKKFGIRN